MGIVQTGDKVIMILIVVFFLIGMLDATEMSTSEIPVYQVAIDKLENGDTAYMLQVLRMGFGWAQIAPSFNVDDLANNLPIIGHAYAFYSKIFIPSGYLAYPGFEDFLFLAFIVLLLFPIAVLIKGRRKKRGLDGLPIKFLICLPLLIILLYPIWVWFNVNIMFVPGAETVFQISREEAYQIWINIGENSEQFSWFFAIMTFLGLGKGIQLGWKFKKW